MDCVIKCEGPLTDDVPQLELTRTTKRAKTESAAGKSKEVLELSASEARPHAAEAIVEPALRSPLARWQRPTAEECMLVVTTLRCAYARQRARCLRTPLSDCVSRSAVWRRGCRAAKAQVPECA